MTEWEAYSRLCLGQFDRSDFSCLLLTEGGNIKLNATGCFVEREDGDVRKIRLEYDGYKPEVLVKVIGIAHGFKGLAPHLQTDLPAELLPGDIYRPKYTFTLTPRAVRACKWMHLSDEAKMAQTSWVDEFKGLTAISYRTQDDVCDVQFRETILGPVLAYWNGIFLYNEDGRNLENSVRIVFGMVQSSQLSQG